MDGLQKSGTMIHLSVSDFLKKKGKKLKVQVRVVCLREEKHHLPFFRLD